MYSWLKQQKVPGYKNTFFVVVEPRTILHCNNISVYLQIPWFTWYNVTIIEH